MEDSAIPGQMILSYIKKQAEKPICGISTGLPMSRFLSCLPSLHDGFKLKDEISPKLLLIMVCVI